MALAMALAVAAAGCGQSPPSPSGASSPATTAVVTSPPVSATAAGSSAVTVDASLLALLPPTVDGIDLNESPEAEVDALGDPVVATVGTAIAGAFAADANTGDFVYALVVRLRPEAMNDALFRSWRDTFDEGACSQAGGVTGHAEAEIGGHKTFIGTCAGGLHTYHVWLPAQQRLLSMSALGERRFGEQLLRNLRA
jgi:hypothetical protein